MAKINSVNNKAAALTVDPGASGDSYIQLDINSTGEFRIGVDDTDDSYRISRGSALGTNDSIIITAAGEITYPEQPAYAATTVGYITNVTGDGTVYTVVFGTEYFDVTSDYDGTSTFTAPYTGKYRFKTRVLYDDITASHTSCYMEIVTSNRTYRGRYYDPGNVAQSDGNINLMELSVLADMDASDTAVVKTMVSGSTKIVEVGFSGRGYFNGVLVC